MMTIQETNEHKTPDLVRNLVKSRESSQYKRKMSLIYELVLQ